MLVTFFIPWYQVKNDNYSCGNQTKNTHFLSVSLIRELNGITPVFFHRNPPSCPPENWSFSFRQSIGSGWMICRLSFCPAVLRWDGPAEPLLSQLIICLSDSTHRANQSWQTQITQRWIPRQRRERKHQDWDFVQGEQSWAHIKRCYFNVILSL